MVYFKILFRYPLFFIIIASFLIITPDVEPYDFASLSGEDNWREEKGIHFIIKYPRDSEFSWGNRALREAEKYYDQIALKIGYPRYQNYWTWNDRVLITVFEDSETFSRETGQPEWSRGGANTDYALLSARLIITYKQGERFFNGVLPHEISHLMLQDMIGHDKQIPIWFNEGVAQLQEELRREKADLYMKKMIGQNKFIPFPELFSKDVRQYSDQSQTSLFYAQSVSIVGFLISRYGSSEFAQLCGYLRDGFSFDQALKSTYVFQLNSIGEFQFKWLEYMRKNY